MSLIPTGDLYGRRLSLSIINLEPPFNALLTPNGLRVEFKVSKGYKAKANKATISVYNLSEFNRKQVLAPNSRGGSPKLQVILTAGYGTLQGVLFTGRGVSKTIWKPPNYVTSFELTDGAATLGTSFINKAYPVGTPVDFIISDIAVSLLTSGVVIGPYPPIGAALKRARSFSGSASKILDDLGSKYGFEFDVQDGIGTIRTETVPVDPSLPVILSQYSGLIDKPYTDGKIVRARSLINPLIKPGSSISLAVADPSLVGLYKVKSLVAKGDNFGKDWSMMLEMASLTTKEGFTTLAQLEASILSGGVL